LRNSPKGISMIGILRVIFDESILLSFT